MSQPNRRGVSMRAKSIINYCQKPGAFLHKCFKGRDVAFLLEPGAVRVGAEHAAEAINSGWLVPDTTDLLGDPTNSQTWIYARRMPTSGQGKSRGVRR